MENSNNKKLTSAQLFEKRKEIIDLHNKKMPVMQIVKQSGMTWPAVNKAIKLYKSGGNDIEALLPKMGRTSGSGRILTPEQEDEIKMILYTRQPYGVRISCKKGVYLTLPSADEIMAEWQYCLLNDIPYTDAIKDKHTGDYQQYLWCRDSVKELIRQKSGIGLSPRSVDQYLYRWGFPKTKQNQRPVERCSELIKRWLEENPLEDIHPKVYWLYRKRFKTEKNKKQSIISATDNHRRVFWTVIQGNFSQEKQIGFLRSLVYQSRRPITVVRSNHRYYLQNEVKTWLDGQSDIILAPPLLQKELETMRRDREREAAVWPEIKRERMQKAEQELEKKDNITTDIDDVAFYDDIDLYDDDLDCPF